MFFKKTVMEASVLLKLHSVTLERQPHFLDKLGFIEVILSKLNPVTDILCDIFRNVATAINRNILEWLLVIKTALLFNKNPWKHTVDYVV